jgi:hypothetical protein
VKFAAFLVFIAVKPAKSLFQEKRFLELAIDRAE